ncbi:hypothetical protein D3C72_1853970 [compost metagenome]
MVAREGVHDGLVERMAHVQRAGHVGGRQLDGEVLVLGSGLGVRVAGATVACVAITALFPLGAPVGFDGRRLKRLGEAVEARLGDRCGIGFAHGVINGKRHRGWGCRSIAIRQMA